MQSICFFYAFLGITVSRGLLTETENCEIMERTDILVIRAVKK